MYWVTLILGIIILCRQVYNYFYGRQDLTIEEGIVFLVAIVMMVNPHVIGGTWKIIVTAIIHAKNGK